jgi:hypothetical protein
VRIQEYKKFEEYKEFNGPVESDSDLGIPLLKLLLPCTPCTPPPVQFKLFTLTGVEA